MCNLFFIIYFLFFNLCVYSKTYDNSFFNGECFNELLKNFRCIVCQNQSLYDSTSEFAIGIKKEIYTMVVMDYNTKDIIDFMIKNYGEVVSYTPILSEDNFILWILPLIFIIIGFIFFIFIVKGSKI